MLLLQSKRTQYHLLHDTYITHIVLYIFALPVPFEMSLPGWTLRRWKQLAAQPSLQKAKCPALPESGPTYSMGFGFIAERCKADSTSKHTGGSVGRFLLTVTASTTGCSFRSWHLLLEEEHKSSSRYGSDSKQKVRTAYSTHRKATPGRPQVLTSVTRWWWRAREPQLGRAEPTRVL